MSIIYEPTSYKLDESGVVLLKNGEACICPRNPGVMVARTDIISVDKKPPTMEKDYLYCNSACPYFFTAVKKSETEEISGFVLKCMDKPLFLTKDLDNK